MRVGERFFLPNIVLNRFRWRLALEIGKHVPNRRPITSPNLSNQIMGRGFSSWPARHLRVACCQGTQTNISYLHNQRNPAYRPEPTVEAALNRE